MPKRAKDTGYQRWVENDVRYSTGASHDWRPGGARYVSAEDAVDQYLRLQSEMNGQPAIDYERAMGVDTSPSPENPATLKAHEAFFLEERIFKQARRWVRPYHWRVWGVIRFDMYSIREAYRTEERRRRREIKDTHTAEELEAWCAHYRLEFPEVDDPWTRLKAEPGISHQTAWRYRRLVDQRVEQALAEEGVLVRGAVRPDEVPDTPPTEVPA